MNSAPTSSFTDSSNQPRPALSNEETGAQFSPRQLNKSKSNISTNTSTAKSKLLRILKRGTSNSSINSESEPRYFNNPPPAAPLSLSLSPSKNTASSASIPSYPISNHDESRSRPPQTRLASTASLKSAPGTTNPPPGIPPRLSSGLIPNRERTWSASTGSTSDHQHQSQSNHTTHSSSSSSGFQSSLKRFNSSLLRRKGSKNSILSGETDTDFSSLKSGAGNHSKDKSDYSYSNHSLETREPSDSNSASNSLLEPPRSSSRNKIRNPIPDYELQNQISNSSSSPSPSQLNTPGTHLQPRKNQSSSPGFDPKSEMPKGKEVDTPNHSGGGWKMPFGSSSKSKSNQNLTAEEISADKEKKRKEQEARILGGLDILMGPSKSKPKEKSSSQSSGSKDARAKGKEKEKVESFSNSNGGVQNENSKNLSLGLEPTRSNPSHSGSRSKLERMMGEDVPRQTGASESPKQYHHSPNPSASSSAAAGPSRNGVGHSPQSSSTYSTVNHSQPNHPNGTGSHSPTAAFSTLSSSPSNLHQHQHFSQSQAGGSQNRSQMDSASCPVCLIPMSYRLSGEKPHVVPLCGHALHNACFTAVYGPPEAVRAAQMRNAGGNGQLNAPGMCGVCRRAIVLGENEGMRRHNKLTGMGVEDGGPQSSGSSEFPPSAFDGPVQSDDEFSEGSKAPSVISSLNTADSTANSQGRPHVSVTRPIIKARPEYGTIYRKDKTGQNGKQNVVCIVSIEIPSRRPPAPPLVQRADEFNFDNDLNAVSHHLGTIPDQEDDELAEQKEEEWRQQQRAEAETKEREEPERRERDQQMEQQNQQDHRNQQQQGLVSYAQEGSNGLDDSGSKEAGASESGDRSSSPTDPDEAGFSFGATPAASDPKGPFQSIMDDLKARVSDWKGHTMDHFGPLILYDFLSVRQDTVVREFYVYLFREALLCVTEEKKRGLARFITSNTVSGTSGSSTAMQDTSNGGPKPALKLKGRIYLRHIRRVMDSSVAGELSLSIKMDDDSLDHFVLRFKERSELETWQGRMTELVQAKKDQRKAHQMAKQAVTAGVSNPSSANLADSSIATQSSQVDLSNTLDSSNDGRNPIHQNPPSPQVLQFASSNRPMRSASGASTQSGKSGSAPPPPSGPPPPVSAPPSPSAPFAKRNVNLAKQRVFGQNTQVQVPLHQQWSASGGHDPSKPSPELLPHTPIDLVLMISVPSIIQPVNSGGMNNAGPSVSSSAALKLRLIRSSLEFIISHVGPRDRVALITYSVGVDGEVRRTALLNPSKDHSRNKLKNFIEGIGKPWDGDSEDPFREDLAKLGGASDRIDTVTAVNVGLDIVLQRKSKNPITGMLLVNDTADGPRRGQMDLVMARAEAANVPVHCFGYGKSHDPSSLWLISNHTRGSYTFVKEWYELRECLAGCIGSLMSVALTDVKIHISVPSDNHFRVRKVAGPMGAIVSATGKDVDIELGEARFGETKELFVELELDFSALAPLPLERTNGRPVGFKSQGGTSGGGGIEQGSATDDFMQRLGLQNLNLADNETFEGNHFEQMIEEIAVFEIDAGFKDAASGVTVSRMANPSIMTVEIDPVSNDPISEGAPGQVAVLADPVVTRRRLQILVSDMMTRSLLLVSRKNHSQALKILTETRRIVDTVVQSIPTPTSIIHSNSISSSSDSTSSRRSSLNSNSTSSNHQRTLGTTTTIGGPRKQREALNLKTIESLAAIIEDLDILTDGLEQSKSAFDRDQRNFGAQQAMVLRDQKAWTTRSDTEALHFTYDNGSAYTAISSAFASFTTGA